MGLSFWHFKSFSVRVVKGESDIMNGSQADEGTRLVPKLNSGKSFPEPLSLAWRINHTIPYLIGGTTFLLGSYQYLPAVSNFVFGGWLFTIGSTGFLYADLSEWWKNNRVGCAFDEDFREDYEAQFASYYDSPTSNSGKYQRAENGLNFAFSAFGSLLYLIGSIMFIPDLNLMVQGTVIFIPGSAVIFVSQMIKLYRAGCVAPPGKFNQFQYRAFAFGNLSQDMSGVGVDLFAGLGGFAYMIGSYLFLPSIAVTPEDVTRAAVWFLCGGAFFTLSGLCIVYRYFCTLNFAH